MKPHLPLCLSAIFALVSAYGVRAADPPCAAGDTVVIDVVEAAQGREVAGDTAISATNGRYTYLFASKENVTKFLMHEENYVVMWDGCCGRMGPLSGRGSPERYAVHDGRVFFFASEPCRKAFLQDPTLCIEKDEAAPSPQELTPESTAKARALLDKAVAAMGGAERIDRVAVWREHRTAKAQDDPNREDSVTLTLRFPDAAHLREAWGEHAYSRYVVDGSGAFVDKEGVTPMVPSQVDAMEREVARHPLVILRGRNEDGFVAMAVGPGVVGGVRVENVRVFLHGATSTLSIDPETGRVLSVAYRGRGPRSLLGDVEQVYSDFRDTAGIMAPYASATTWNTQPMGDAAVVLNIIEVDPVTSPDLFGGGAAGS